MMSKTQVFLASVDQSQEQKFNRFMIDGFDRKKFDSKQLLKLLKSSENIRVWGFPMSEKNKIFWSNVNENDWFIFYLNGKYSYTGQVQEKIRDENLQKIVNSSKSPYKMELLVLFKNLIPTSLGFLKTNNAFGIESSIPSMHRISFMQADQNSVDKVLRQYKSIKNFIEKNSLEKTNLEQITVQIQPTDIKEPPRKFKSNTIRFIRDTAISEALKKLYNNKCQICGFTINLDKNVGYSEAHHVWPLGEGGIDNYDNMIVLCPNHHAEFDYAAIGFHPHDKTTIIDRFGESMGRIHFRKGHSLKASNIEYHQRRMRSNYHGS